MSDSSIIQAVSANGVPSGGSSGQKLVKNSGTSYDTSWTDVNEIPTGGSAGQALTKVNGTNYNVTWSTIQQPPTGGSTGQVLTKNSGTNYDYSWQTPSGGGPIAEWVATGTATASPNFSVSSLRSFRFIAYMYVYSGQGSPWIAINGDPGGVTRLYMSNSNNTGPMYSYGIVTLNSTGTCSIHWTATWAGSGTPTNGSNTTQGATGLITSIQFRGFGNNFESGYFVKVTH